MRRPRNYGFHGADAVFDCGGEAVFGRQTIVDGEDAALACCGQGAADGAMRSEIAPKAIPRRENK